MIESLIRDEVPAPKQRAIDAMEMGVLNKCYLRFPRAFWDRERMNLVRFSDTKGAWAYWVNVESFSGEPILGGLNAASIGTALESLDDRAIVAEAMAALRGMYGNGVPAPVGHRITRWRSDPFAFGSYSFIPTEANNDMRDDWRGRWGIVFSLPVRRPKGIIRRRCMALISRVSGRLGRWSRRERGCRADLVSAPPQCRCSGADSRLGRVGDSGCVVPSASSPIPCESFRGPSAPVAADNSKGE